MLPFRRMPRAAFLAVALGLLPPAHGQGWLCATGGGEPSAEGWGRAVFGWMVAKGAQGDVLILGAAPSDAESRAAASAFALSGARSVSELVVDEQAANRAATVEAILAAEVVWLRDGVPARCISAWRGTRTEAALREHFRRGGVVGGTGGGAALLGEVIHDARSGEAEPRDVLADPYHPTATFTTGFLELGRGLVFDVRFTARGRLGRLAAFVPRIARDLGRDLVGAGIDERTALCLSPDGRAEVLGEGAVTLLSQSPSTHSVVLPGEALVATEVVHTQLVEGYAWDLATRAVVARPGHAIPSGDPIAPAAFHELFLSGDSESDAHAGEYVVLDHGDPSALVHGALEVVYASADVFRGIVATRVWSDAAFVENRVGGLQYALALHPHFLGLYLDGPVRVTTDPSGYAHVDPPVGGDVPLVVLDGSGVTTTALSTHVSGAESAGPRQSVALESARLHVLREGLRYLATPHACSFATSFGAGEPSSLGYAAWLSPQGTPAVGSGDFAIDVRDAVPGASGMLLEGGSQAATPFGGGTLYLGGTITRHALHVLDSVGATSCPIRVPGELAGSTRYFQFWYRDPLRGGGDGAALTDAVRALCVL